MAGLVAFGPVKLAGLQGHVDLPAGDGCVLHDLAGFEIARFFFVAEPNAICFPIVGIKGFLPHLGRIDVGMERTCVDAACEKEGILVKKQMLGESVRRRFFQFPEFRAIALAQADELKLVAERRKLVETMEIANDAALKRHVAAG